MLLLAAANRFHLGPRLEVMVREGNYDRSVALMRNSILTEFVVAIIILGAVAWLGMLAPSPGQLGDSQSSCVRFYFHISELTMQRILIVEDEQKQVVTCSRDWLRKAIRPISLIMAAMVSGPRRRDSMI